MRIANAKYEPRSLGIFFGNTPNPPPPPPFFFFQQYFYGNNIKPNETIIQAI